MSANPLWLETAQQQPGTKRPRAPGQSDPHSDRGHPRTWTRETAPPVWSAEQAALYYNVNPGEWRRRLKAIERMLERGKRPVNPIPFFRIGREYRHYKADLFAWEDRGGSASCGCGWPAPRRMGD